MPPGNPFPYGVLYRGVLPQEEVPGCPYRPRKGPRSPRVRSSVSSPERSRDTRPERGGGGAVKSALPFPNNPLSGTGSAVADPGEEIDLRWASTRVEEFSASNPRRTKLDSLPRPRPVDDAINESPRSRLRPETRRCASSVDAYEKRAFTGGEAASGRFEDDRSTGGGAHPRSLSRRKKADEASRFSETPGEVAPVTWIGAFLRAARGGKRYDDARQWPTEATEKARKTPPPGYVGVVKDKWQARPCSRDGEVSPSTETPPL